MTDICDREAAAYDGWYDTPSGQAVLRDELRALHRSAVAGLMRAALAAISDPIDDLAAGRYRVS